jgi:hypothetical protein
MPVRSAPDVVRMFAELGLPVCDDTSIIQEKVDSQRQHYFRNMNSPDPDTRHKAHLWFNDVEVMLHRRSELIRAVYAFFASQADVSLKATFTESMTVLPPELKIRLRELLSTVCHVDDKLADRFLNEYIREHGLMEKEMNFLGTSDSG